MVTCSPRAVGGADAPGGLAGGQAQGPGEDGLEVRLADRLGQPDRLGGAEGAVVDQGGAVAGLLEALQEVDQPRPVVAVQPTVVDDSIRWSSADGEAVKGGVGRGRPACLDALGLHAAESTEAL